MYWTTRTKKYGNSRHTKLLQKQKGQCTWCKKPFITGDTLEVDHIRPKAMQGKDEYLQ